MTRQKSRSAPLNALCALLQTRQFWQQLWTCCRVSSTPRWFVPRLNTTFVLVHLSTPRDVEGPFCWMEFTAPVKRYVWSRPNFWGLYTHHALTGTLIKLSCFLWAYFHVFLLSWPCLATWGGLQTATADPCLARAQSSSLLFTVVELICDSLLWNLYFHPCGGCLLSSVRDLRGLIVALRMCFVTAFTEDDWHCRDRSALQKHLGNTASQSGSVLFGEPVLFCKGCSQERAHSSLFGITDCLSTTAICGPAGSLNWVQLRTSFLQRWCVASKCWHLPVHRQTVVQVSLLSQISIWIHLASHLSALLRGFSSFCIITQEQHYGNPFWSHSLGSFQSQAQCPSFFAPFLSSFSKELVWTFLFPPLANLLSCANIYLQKEAEVSVEYFLHR